MRTRLIVLGAVLLFVGRSAAAQFTIPDNTAGTTISPAQSVWMETDITDLVAGIGGRGVVSGAGVSAQGSPDMTVAVASGSVYIGGATVSVSSGNVAISAANSINPRIDIVAVNNAGTKSAITGTAAASPGPPALPTTSVALAFVYVPANDTAITTNQIVDKRVFLPYSISPAALASAFTWSSYTPSWTASSVNPTLGNGSIQGRYLQIGKLVHFQLSISMGSTTTFGTGTYAFSLPTSAASGVTMIGDGRLFDSGTNSRLVLARKETSTTFALYQDQNTGNGIGPTVPFTFAANDLIEVQGSYEAP